MLGTSYLKLWDNYVIISFLNDEQEKISLTKGTQMEPLISALC